MSVQTIRRGALAGALATVPMTAVMGIGKAAGWMVTPPPKQVTAKAQAETGLAGALGHPAFTVSWLTAHFAFGAVAGAFFAEERSKFPPSSVLAGTLYGTAIWAAAYGAVLPALNLYPSLTGDSHSRTAVMLLAHQVFGVTLARASVSLVGCMP